MCSAILVDVILLFSFVHLSTENRLKRNKLNNCFVNVENTEIDYSKLYIENGYTIVSGNKSFIINICGPAIKCGQNATACLLNEEGHNKIIGSLNCLQVHQFRLKYKCKTSENRFETIIDFKCNRHFTKPHIIYDSEPTMGIYKFICYTSLVCIKTPTPCKVLDMERNLQYDIARLFHTNSEWTVRNVSHGIQIYLNLCGNLQNLTRKNECSYEDTHICLINQHGEERNLGVFPSAHKINEDGLSITFTGGSLCGNLSTISTNVDFICSFNETGPVLKYSSECEYKIIWKTPIACPYYSSINENCIVKNYIQGMQKEPLYVSQDKEKQLSTNTIVRYNICGYLNSTCNGQHLVSVCLIQKDKEIVFGVMNNTLFTKDATISMYLTGELCRQRNTFYSTKVIFRCNYQQKDEEIIINQDLCSAIIIVYTIKVCRQSTNIPVKNCEISTNDTNYDLTPLIRNQNYQIKDENDKTIDYLLNICSPIVFNENAFCPVDTVVCIRNNSEPDLYKRFNSIAHTLKSSALKIENDNKLKIVYEGKICRGSLTNYKTTIEFECTYKIDYQITMFKTECAYTFVWKTKYACPITKDAPLKLSITSTPSLPQTTKDVKEYNNIDLQITTQKPYITTKNFHENDKIVKNNNKLQTAQTTNDPYSIKTVLIYVPKKVFNFTSIPRVINGLHEKTHISSISGKSYELILSDVPTEIFCSSSILCLTHPIFTSNYTNIVMDFSKPVDFCKNGYYNCVIIFKCHDESVEPVIINEDKCSIQIEWHNAITCPPPSANSKDSESPIIYTSGFSTTLIVIITFVIIILISVLLFATYYYFRRRRILPAHSGMSLMSCEYNKLKDAAKIA